MINPVSITTNNVAREILRISTQNAVPSSSLYINVTAIRTFVKDANTEFIEISYEDFQKYTQEEILRDPDIEFQQEYDVTIRSQYDNYPFARMNCEIEFEDKATTVNLIIKKGSSLSYYDDLEQDFSNYIVEQQLRSSVMLQLFDVNYKESLKVLIDVLQQIKTITFKEDKKILISQGLRELESIQAEILMTIEAKKEEDENAKIDYSDRNYLMSCIEGEELFEFSKPKQGKHGRDCRGKLIEVEIVNLDAKPEFDVNDNIEIQDSFQNIKYLATKSGYLIRDGENYNVSNSIDIDEISFKTTGTIDTDLETEISINIVKDDPLEDAIEKGMKVRVQNLSTDGSIGPSTEIEARNVSISGQTHASSLIQCVDAQLGTHKGKIIARSVNIKTLQGGEVIADNVLIEHAMSGKIKAKTIKIKVLGSYVVLEASEYIEISRTRGEENKFIFHASANSGLDNNEDNQEDYLKQLKNELNTLIEKYKIITIKVKKNLEPCKKIKDSILKSKAHGVKISSILIDKYKLCRVMNVHYKKIQEDVKFKKTQYDELYTKLSSCSLDVMNSKLLLEEPLNGFNHIKYILTKPDRKIELNINATMNKKVFQLIKDEDGILKIINKCTED